jgi:8-oxo-dGTP pyrophosphatase MutT (NUDIX family)
MLVLNTDAGRFSCRAAGLALHDGAVLLQRDQRSDAWFLPGGRIEMLETTHDTLLREMQEELQVDVQIERLLWVSEHFFTSHGKPRHEIAFYFLMTMPPEFIARTRNAPFFCYEADITFVFRWLPLHRLPALNVMPRFLVEKLHALPQHTEHMMTVSQSYTAAQAGIQPGDNEH